MVWTLELGNWIFEELAVHFGGSRRDSILARKLSDQFAYHTKHNASLMNYKSSGFVIY